MDPGGGPKEANKNICDMAGPGKGPSDEPNDVTWDRRGPKRDQFREFGPGRGP